MSKITTKNGINILQLWTKETTPGLYNEQYAYSSSQTYLYGCKLTHQGWVAIYLRYTFSKEYDCSFQFGECNAFKFCGRISERMRMSLRTANLPIYPTSLFPLLVSLYLFSAPSLILNTVPW